MSSRIDEYHGADAKPLTTAEVEGMPHRTERARPFALECSMHVLVRRDELLATTRALETAQRDALEAQGSEEGLVRELNSAQDRALARLRERDEAQARAEKAEAERDEALAKTEEAIIKADLFERHWRKALAERDEAHAEVARRDALAVSTELMTRTQIDQIRAESKTLAYEVVRERDTARFERDAARRELAELALEVGYGERPEGQDHIIHASGPELARAWLLERKGRDQAEADRDAARARVAELETALGDSARSRDWPCLDCQPESKEKASLNTLVSELVAALDEIVRRWDADYEGLVHSDPIDAARAALAKAKEAKP